MRHTAPKPKDKRLKRITKLSTHGQMFKQLGARGRWHAGLVLLATVVLLWVASGFIINDVSRTYNKPFFITYVNTAMFAVYLIPTVVQIHRDRARRGSVYALLDGSPGTGGGLTVRETATVAAHFAVLWFTANLLNNASYVYTDVASATILACTSSFFTLLLGAVFGVETVTWPKVGALFVSIAGVCLVTGGSGGSGDSDGPAAPRPLLGNVLALGSAFFYGLYTTLLKLRVRDETQLNSQMFLGFVGVFNIVSMLPVLVVFHVAGVETFALPSSARVWALLAVNCAGMLLSDLCWVLAMLMTTPLTVTVGLSATIPLSMLGEVIFNGRHADLLYYVGAALVAWSFFVVNRSEESEVVPSTDPVDV